MQSAEDIIRFIQSNDWIMSLLIAVKEIDEPDCWVAAGAIRNPIWAKLHGVEFHPDNENDVDVIYFDKSNTSRSTEQTYEKTLSVSVPTVKWEVRNQARMHIKNGDHPYKDCSHAMEHWAETATAIGARIGKNGVELLTPYGVEDLLNLTVRHTPKFMHKGDIYNKRIEDKAWHKMWPLLDII